jgi:hypothetical protein
MKGLKGLIAITAFSLVVLALPSVASAQWGPEPGYGNQRGPGYGNQRDLRRVADRLRNGGRDFERQVQRLSNDRRRGNQYYNQRELRSAANDFRRAADNFRSRYGNGRNLNNSADAARRLLDAGARVDRIMRQGRGNPLMGQWNRMRGDLNAVAQVYGYRYDNRGGNYPNNRGGDWRDRVRFPLPF